MSLTLFINDSYFSYLIAKPLISEYFLSINRIIFSTSTKKSFKKIFRIFLDTHIRYFIYRSIIEIIQIYSGNYKKKTVNSLAREYNIKYDYEVNINNIDKNKLKADIGIAINFDQIFRNNIIDLFSKGIINVHASKLPEDRGISPVIWSFARGETQVWSTIFKIDSGIDSGPIYKQFSIDVLEEDSLFSLYERVCSRSGDELVDLLSEIIEGTAILSLQGESIVGNYCRLPGKAHRLLMAESKKIFLSKKDIKRFIF